MSSDNADDLRARALLTFERVDSVSWEAYEVRRSAEAIGFVSRLPAGDWLAYTARQRLDGRYSTREAAADALRLLGLAPATDAATTGVPLPPR